MRGVDSLIELRKRGLLPGKSVLIFWDANCNPRWLQDGLLPEASVTPEESHRADLRAFVGLEVSVLARAYENRLWAFIQRLKGISDSVICPILDWAGEEYGFFWKKGMDEFITIRERANG